MNEKISIIFTLYNRGFEIEDCIISINDLLSKNKISLEIIICDDGSTDNTNMICAAIEKKYSFVKFISYAKNMGRGYAVKYSTKFCTGSKILYLDSDANKTSSLPFISQLIHSLNDNDVVLGNRFSDTQPYKRKFFRDILGKTYHILRSIILPELKFIHDTEIGFKGFKANVLKDLVLKSKENKWGFDTEIIYLAVLFKQTIFQIPIVWNENYKEYNSSVNLILDPINQFISLLKIRFNKYL